MLDQDISSLITVDERDRPEGILTSTDFVHLVADQTSENDTLVEEYMSSVNTAFGLKVI